ncbi:MAG: class I SAM-dependent methyltransferase [Myxococcales bacterium]|nr:MAG: class I SAM-dependent methyltransferase [Myxococcales bacterium]
METRKLYNTDASRWKRKEPNSLSDFTGRPAVFDLCGDVTGRSVLDAGCGEGYCSREMRIRGASRVLGIELSEKMVDLAKAQEQEQSLGIEYQQGDVRKLDLPSESFDLVLAVFVFNYISTRDMQVAMKEMHRVLKGGGQFVFSVPHPCFAFMRQEKSAPFYFDMEGRGYFSGVDCQNQGKIFCRDGTELRVQAVHKTLQDYFDAFEAVGFRSMPVVKELRVLDKHLELDPAFFSPVKDIPLHMAFRLEK